MSLWHPEPGELLSWLREWERLVLGGPAAGYVHRESIEQGYSVVEYESRRDGVGDALEALDRASGGDIRDVRVCAGSGELSFLADHGPRGGRVSVQAVAPDGVAGAVPLHGTFTEPEEVGAWLDRFATGLLGHRYAAAAGTGRYEAPLAVAVHGMTRHRRGPGRCALRWVTGDRTGEFVVDLDDLEAGTRVLLVPESLQCPRVAGAAALHAWLAPLVGALLGSTALPDLTDADSPLPGPLTARIADLRCGKACIQVGGVRTRWVESAADVAPLLHPAVHSVCLPDRAADLAAWLTGIAGTVFGAGGTATTWATNWPGLTSPVGISGGAGDVAVELFAGWQPLRAVVRTADAEFLEVRVTTPDREIALGGWPGPDPPPVRLA